MANGNDKFKLDFSPLLRRLGLPDDGSPTYDVATVVINPRQFEPLSAEALNLLESTVALMNQTMVLVETAAMPVVVPNKAPVKTPAPQTPAKKPPAKKPPTKKAPTKKGSKKKTAAKKSPQ